MYLQIFSFTFIHFGGNLLLSPDISSVIIRLWDAYDNVKRKRYHKNKKIIAYAAVYRQPNGEVRDDDDVRDWFT